jgi:hypothetical protein
MWYCGCVLLMFSYAPGYASSVLAYVRGTPGFMAPEICMHAHVGLGLCGTQSGSPRQCGVELDGNGTDLAGECYTWKLFAQICHSKKQSSARVEEGCPQCPVAIEATG